MFSLSTFKTPFWFMHFVVFTPFCICYSTTFSGVALLQFMAHTCGKEFFGTFFLAHTQTHTVWQRCKRHTRKPNRSCNHFFLISNDICFGFLPLCQVQPAGHNYYNKWNGNNNNNNNCAAAASAAALRLTWLNNDACANSTGSLESDKTNDHHWLPTLPLLSTVVSAVSAAASAAAGGGVAATR